MRNDLDLVARRDIKAVCIRLGGHNLIVGGILPLFFEAAVEEDCLELFFLSIAAEHHQQAPVRTEEKALELLPCEVVVRNLFEIVVKKDRALVGDHPDRVVVEPVDPQDQLTGQVGPPHLLLDRKLEPADAREVIPILHIHTGDHHRVLVLRKGNVNHHPRRPIAEDRLFFGIAVNRNQCKALVRACHQCKILVGRDVRHVEWEIHRPAMYQRRLGIKRISGPAPVVKKGTVPSMRKQRIAHAMLCIERLPARHIVGVKVGIRQKEQIVPRILQL